MHQNSGAFFFAVSPHAYLTQIFLKEEFIMNYTEIKGYVDLHSPYDPKGFMEKLSEESIKNVSFAFLGGNWFTKDEDEEVARQTAYEVYKADWITSIDYASDFGFSDGLSCVSIKEFTDHEYQQFPYCLYKSRRVHFFSTANDITDEDVTSFLSYLQPYIKSGEFYLIGENANAYKYEFINPNNWKWIHKWKQKELPDVYSELTKISTDELIEEIKKRGFVVSKHETGLTDFLDDVDVDDLGCAVVDAFYEDDNYPRYIGKSVYATFKDCRTKDEFDVANRMLNAICRHKIKYLLDRM